MTNSNDENATSEGVENVSAPFGFNLEEIKSISLLGVRKKADRRVCVCGHSLGSHGHGYRSKWMCSNGKLSCPCQDLFPVLEASDLRYFHFKTEGWGPRHALSLGIQKCIERGGKVTPLISESCFICGESSNRLIATSLTFEKVILEQPGPLNAILCQDCWAELPTRGY